uniref:RING-type E3 ubiquitin transferase n=1 Tax=Phaeodactylum tricornutum TaxID=2850 RepID=A0A8J9X2W9_PHATR
MTTIPMDDHGNDDDHDEQRLQRERERAVEQMLWAQEQAEQQDQRQSAHDPNPTRSPLPDDPAVPFPPLPDEQEPPLPPPLSHQNKSWSYTQWSFAAAGATLWYALRTRDEQWYLAVVYLHSSRWACAVLGNALLAAAVATFQLTVRLFLPNGGLRVHEAEGLQDFFRWNVTETCLALTMFRSELTVQTAVEFVVLILCKCLHHVANMREQHVRMTQDAVVRWRPERIAPQASWPPLPAVPTAHWRILVFLGILQLGDLYALQYFGRDIAERGPSVNILFAFEAAILLVSAWSHLLLWHIYVGDGLLHFGHDHYPRSFVARWLHTWKEYKATLTFAVELQAQTVQFLFYLTFFAIVMTYYGVPINLFREVYVSFAALKDRLWAFLRYRQLMASMDRFDSVTDEELEQAGRDCIICRDEMKTHDCKALPVCRHLFHKSCLREWLVQQQTCPTCRSDIGANEVTQERRRAAQAAAQERQSADESTPSPATTSPDILSPADASGSVESPSGAESPPTLTEEDGHDFETMLRHYQTTLQARIRQRSRPALVLPGLYQVTRSSGASVYTGAHDDATHQTPTVVRTVPRGVVVLALEGATLRFVGPEPVEAVRIPDGWMALADVEFRLAIGREAPRSAI